MNNQNENNNNFFSDNYFLEGYDLLNEQEVFPKGTNTMYTPLEPFSEHEYTAPVGFVDKGVDSEPEQTVEEEVQQLALYMLTDRELTGLMEYYRESGINVTQIYFDVMALKNRLLIQSDPCRIVVVETGLGTFTTTKIREELIDMLGMVDEYNHITVFYTDSAIKSDAKRSLGKISREIDWVPYKSTLITAAALLNYRETYLPYTSEPMEKGSTESEILGFKGLRDSSLEGQRLQVKGLSPSAIFTNLVSSDVNVLPGFELKF